MRDSARYGKIQDSYQNFRENLVVYHKNNLVYNRSRDSFDKPHYKSSSKE